MTPRLRAEEVGLLLALDSMRRLQGLNILGSLAGRSMRR